jgi:predicted amidophosphoribosyltransferase
VVSIFFPSDCRLCERLLTSSSRVPICAGCLKSFAAVQGGTCEICGGKPEASFAAQGSKSEGDGLQQERIVCAVCKTRAYAFDRARSYAEYEGALIRAIVTLKFERIEPLGVWFADRLVEVVKREAEVLEADVVVPVPLHSQRHRERGYNQAELIARPLARRLGFRIEGFCSCAPALVRTNTF